MRNLLSALFVLFLLVAGVGWFFQWYSVELDTHKVGKDFSTLREKIREAVNQQHK